MNAIEQVGIFWVGCVFAYWLSVMDHADDGHPHQKPKQLHVRQNHAYTIDPGMKLAQELSA